MDAVILDTNIVSYLMRGHTLAEQYRPDLEGRTLAVSFMTVGELFEGAYRRNWSPSKMDELKQRLRSYIVVPYSSRISEMWGRIRAARKAMPIAVDDAWIAATAVAHTCPLITHNPNDFHGIADLKIITHYTT